MGNNNINEFKIKLIKGKYYHLKDKYLKAQKDGYLPLSSFKDSEMGQFTEEEILASIQNTLKEKADLSIQDSEKLLNKATNLYNKYKYFYKKNILENKLNETNLFKKILAKLYLFLFYKNIKKLEDWLYIFIVAFIIILPIIIISALKDNFFFNTIANFMNITLPFSQTIVERSNLNSQHTNLILAYSWAASIFALVWVMFVQYSYKFNFNNLEKPQHKLNIKKSFFSHQFKVYILIILLISFACIYFLFIMDIGWEKFSEGVNKLEADGLNALYIQYAHPLFTVAFFAIIILLGQYTKIKNSYFKSYKKIYELKS